MHHIWPEQYCIMQEQFYCTMKSDSSTISFQCAIKIDIVWSKTFTLLYAYCVSEDKHANKPYYSKAKLDYSPDNIPWQKIYSTCGWMFSTACQNLVHLKKYLHLCMWMIFYRIKFDIFCECGQNWQTSFEINGI